MSARPIWFGPADRPLFGFFHTPSESTARAGVVICPPLGRDYAHAHYALRLLAERLAEQGLCVLRFDYEGTGDSAGPAAGPERVPAWLASVAAAVDLVRAAGPSSVVLVGMRLGATLAGVAAGRLQDLDGLVLWDPVPSGRAYLSEQRALAALSLPGLSDGRPAGPPDGPSDDSGGSVETPGMVFDAPTVAGLRTLDLLHTEGPLARRILVLARPDRQTGRLAQRLDLPHVEWDTAEGQADLMDVGSPNQVLPHGDIARVGAWIERLFDPKVPAVAVSAPPVASGAVVARGPAGEPVVETPTSLGPAGLFGIVTEVPGHQRGPTVLLLNVANEHRLGPARLWVDLARQWALAGVRSCRLDLSGLGDSPTRRTDQRRFVTRAPEAFDDLVDACRALRPNDPGEVVLVGLCASAYQALDSAFDTHPRSVVAINPVLSFRPPELASEGRLDPRRHVALPRKSALQALHGTGDGLVPRLRRRFPGLNARGRDLTEVVESLLAPRRRRPVVWLRQLAEQGVDVLLVCGEREARPVRLSGTGRSFRRLERTGAFGLALIAQLEHGLLIADHRRAVGELATRHVLRLTGDRPPVSRQAGPSISGAPHHDVSEPRDKVHA